MIQLSCHGDNLSAKYRVYYEPLYAHKETVFYFKVVGKEKWNVNRSWPLDCPSQWGLWEHDVVELFIELPDQLARYFEFQVSPLGQKFNLGVISPRLHSFSPLTIKWSHWVECFQDVWESWLIFPFASSPGQWRGNAHACLGASDSREYFSLYKANDGPIDFHRPKYFSEL